MRRALVLVLLLLIPSTWAEEDNGWAIEVEDPFGNPISDCDITLSEPWTGSILEEPVGAMYQPRATCEGYVVMWHPPVPTSQTTVVLDAYPIIEDLFTVEGAHTIQVLGSTWEKSVSDGLIDAPNGVPVLVIGNGGSEIRYGQSQITIPNGTTTYNLSGNFSDDVSVIAAHTGSGEIVNWIDGNLTVGESGGGWSARVILNGLPKGNSSWPPTSEWVEEQLNSSIIAGNANIEFTSNLTPNEEITGLWTANHLFSDGFGLPFIPGVQAGIDSQVNRFLNGDVNELENLLETIIYTTGSEALCCIIDDNTVMFSNFSIDAEIDMSTGTWGWNETGTITASRSNINLLRLEIPFQNDLRQTTPLTITTDGDWQYLSSPLEEWIGGSSSNFTLQRDASSVSGYYTITLGQNNAPEVSMAEGYALPWENTSYDFDAVIQDEALSVHDCVWNISGLSDNHGINLSAYDIDSDISVTVTCTDEGGLSDSWNGTFVLDGGTPWINASSDVQIIEPGIFEWDLMVGDDHDDNLRVYWTSNKSEDWWYTGDILHTSFVVDSNLNSINDNITERHKARNPVEYWLSAEVTDDVGHSTSGNWTIRLSDNSGPVILGSLELQNEDGLWETSGAMFSPGDRVRLNLTESFDDHSSIDKINFTIEHQGIVNTGLSWSEIQFWELPEFGTGYHQIKINGLDESGNLGGSMVSVAVSPPIAKNLEVIDITSSSTEIEPGMNQFWVTVQNNGASTTEFILCSDEVCVESLVGPSSYSQNTTAIVLLKVDLDWFETFTVDLTYLDDTNQTIVKHSTSEYHSGMGIGTIELLGIVLVAALAIGWVRSRKGPRF
tara:strand:- start:21 stop:2522 length:2502 start_codon:yes stop_codon:yes gene_type:complete